MEIWGLEPEMQVKSRCKVLIKIDLEHPPTQLYNLHLYLLLHVLESAKGPCKLEGERALEIGNLGDEMGRHMGARAQHRKD